MKKMRKFLCLAGVALAAVTLVHSCNQQKASERERDRWQEYTCEPAVSNVFREPGARGIR